jgi:hypothetical protein
MMCLFLKSIDVWKIVETGWSPPSTTTVEWTIVQTGARLSNEKALHALCQDLSLSEFSRISHCEYTQRSMANSRNNI